MPRRPKLANKHNPYQTFKIDDVEFTIGAEASNAINVAMQFKSRGEDAAERVSAKAYITTDAEGDNITASAPTGGAAIGTNGLAIPLIAGKAFQLVSNASGQVDLTITDTGTPTFYLAVVLPDGGLKVSDAITFV